MSPIELGSPWQSLQTRFHRFNILTFNIFETIKILTHLHTKPSRTDEDSLRTHWGLFTDSFSDDEKREKNAIRDNATSAFGTTHCNVPNMPYLCSVLIIWNRPQRDTNGARTLPPWRFEANDYGTHHSNRCHQGNLRQVRKRQQRLLRYQQQFQPHPPRQVSEQAYDSCHPGAARPDAALRQPAEDGCCMAPRQPTLYGERRQGYRGLPAHGSWLTNVKC